MKYLTLIILALVASTAQTDFWDNCTAYGGTIITANSYGNDKGGLCNDPNDTTLSNNCNGKKFCASGKTMNWWSAFTWCTSIGGQLTSFESACPGEQMRNDWSYAGICANLVGTALPKRGWTNTGYDATHSMIVQGGIVAYSDYAGGHRHHQGNEYGNVALCEQN